MSNFSSRIKSFDEIRVSVSSINGRSVKGRVSLHKDSSEESFTLIFSYSENVEMDRNLAGLILTMPVMNFTFFAKRLVLDFPASEADLLIIRDFVRINAIEVFVNKICRRRYEFFRKEFLPSEDEVNLENAMGDTEVLAGEIAPDPETWNMDARRSIVLSSGGKESLLTYGMMREAGSTVFPVFFNESGGHWRTAKTSYDHFSENYENVSKVWSNVDRFYKFMIRRTAALDQAQVSKLADTYPVQLFIFPVYVFSMIPIIMKHRIGNILMGNEFDDPREMPPYHGIRHYFGIFDQSADFASMVSQYLSSKGIPSTLWSAVYPISGLLVESILIQRYHELFLQQRSCHSCHFESGRIVPCGKCSKCLGVMSFMIAGGGDPVEVGYSEQSVRELKDNIGRTRMRLDSDEMKYIASVNGSPSAKPPGLLDHVKGIHILDGESEPLSSVPDAFRPEILRIMSEYSSGTYVLSGNDWVKS